MTRVVNQSHRNGQIQSTRAVVVSLGNNQQEAIQLPRALALLPATLSTIQHTLLLAVLHSSRPASTLAAPCQSTHTTTPLSSTPVSHLLFYMSRHRLLLLKLTSRPRTQCISRPKHMHRCKQALLPLV